MIEPPPLSFILGMAALLDRIMLLTLIALIRSQSSSVAFHHGAAHGYANVVVQDIQPSITVNRSVNHALAFGGICNVRLHSNGVSALLAYHCQGLLGS